jgi:hypothetical protein
VAWGVVRCSGSIGISLRWCSERWSASEAQALMEMASEMIGRID